MKVKKEVSAGGIVYKIVRSQEPCLPAGRSEVRSPLVWLICQHSQHKGWVFPKGLVGDTDSTESMESAALREVEEEGGVRAKITEKKPIKTTYSYIWNDMKIEKTVYYFLMEYISGDPKNHDWEMSDARFACGDEVKKTLTYSSDKQAFEKILTFFK